MMSKSLVAYFSRRGKNYTNNGIAELKEGNTEIVAKKLAGLTGSDLLRSKLFNHIRMIISRL